MAEKQLIKKHIKFSVLYYMHQIVTFVVNVGHYINYSNW